MKRASYNHAIVWIALNDDAECTDAAIVAGYMSTVLVADLFDVAAKRVADDIVRYRNSAQFAKIKEQQS
jgi:hypothetical protein